MNQVTKHVLFAARPSFDRAEIGFWRRLRDALRTRDVALMLASHTACSQELDVPQVTIASSLDDFFPVTTGVLTGIPLSRFGLDEELLLAREAAVRGPSLVPAVERSRREALALVAAEYVLALQTLAPVLTVIRHGNDVSEWILDAVSRAGGTPVLQAEGEPTLEGLFDADALAERIADWAGATPWCTPPALATEIQRLRGAMAAAWPAAGSTWLDRRDALATRLEEWHHGHALRDALLPAYLAARQHRRVRVWGSGAARRAVCGLLKAAGAAVDDTTIDAEGLQGTRQTPVPDFTIVATAAHDGTTHHLESLGFRRGSDYSVLEPNILHALHVRDRFAGDAA